MQRGWRVLETNRHFVLEVAVKFLAPFFVATLATTPSPAQLIEKLHTQVDEVQDPHVRTVLRYLLIEIANLIKRSYK